MLIRLILAIKNKSQQEYLEKKFSAADVRLESYGQERSPWQKVMRSCGDVFIISEALIPKPVDTGILLMNDLPENPTTVILIDSDSPEDQAHILAAGADAVLYSGISKKSLVEAIETVLEARRQLTEMGSFRRQAQGQPTTSDFVLESDAMRIFIDEVRQVIPSSSPMLILGETGVGKEHLAKAIHAESPRSSGPFIAINTAALPEQLLESELFGHVEGAFTGAVRARRGAFEMAHQGTLFLDEMGEMPLHLQTKLLRILQDYEVKPVGSEKSIQVDVRIIAATNSDMWEAVEKRSFRKDLYYRLSVITLEIPPLRERREDIPFMVEGFLEHFRYRIGREIEDISEEALEALCRYDWPGNVRELMNVIERAILLSQGPIITLKELPGSFRDKNSDSASSFPLDAGNSNAWKGMTLQEVRRFALEHIERQYFEMILKQTRGRVGETARVAGIHPRNLYNRMKKLGLRKEDFRGQAPR